VVAPSAGTVESVSHVTGQVMFREPPVPIVIDAYVDGVVDSYLAGDELKGAEMGDLGTLCWLTATGWYGAD
jgi:hypothetical protein